MSKRKADGKQSNGDSRMDVDGDDSDNESILDVDFEFFGLSPTIDFHGLKTLLRQLFDVDNDIFNLSELADLILSQADHIGTAIKCDGEETDPYAFISVLSLEQHRETGVIKQLMKYLSSRTSSAPDLTKLLKPDSGANIGLVFTERFINMPHQIVPPLYNMLQRETSLAGKDFDFTHLLLLSKTYTEIESKLDAEDDRPQKKQKSRQQTAETFYFHPEDEIWQRHALASATFAYEKGEDEGRSDSKRAFQDLGVKPQGLVILLDAKRVTEATKAVTEYLSAG